MAVNITTILDRILIKSKIKKDVVKFPINQKFLIIKKIAKKLQITNNFKISRPINGLLQKKDDA